MHNFRPAVKSGQWHVPELRDRHPQPTITLTHSHSITHSPECEHPGPIFQGQTDSLHIWELAEGFFPVSTALDFHRKV